MSNNNNNWPVDDKSRHPYYHVPPPSHQSSPSPYAYGSPNAQGSPYAQGPAYAQDPAYAQGPPSGYGQLTATDGYPAPPSYQSLQSSGQDNRSYPNYENSSQNYPPDRKVPSPSGYPRERSSAGQGSQLYPPSHHERGSSAYAQTSSQSTLSPYAGAPSPSRSPSPDPSGQSSFSLASFFGPQGPPAGFARPPPPNLPYESFPALCLLSNSGRLAKGFPELPPPSNVQPHPFATHDIKEDDWKRFLYDIKKAADLTTRQRIRANVIPMVTGVGMIGGMLISNAITKKMEYKNRTAAGDVVDHWNHYFFHPRRMEAVLSQGSQRLSGKDGQAPSVNPDQQRMAANLRRQDSSSSSDSSKSRHHHHGRRAEKDARKQARKDERKAKKKEKEDRRAYKKSGQADLSYELIVVPM